MAITTEVEESLKSCEKEIHKAESKEDIIKVFNAHTGTLGYKKICRMLRGQATAKAIIEKG